MSASALTAYDYAVPQSPPAYVTPAALRWARESIGFPLEEAARRVGVNPTKLEEAERGEAYLTLRQAETAARVYERPLAALFLPEPPSEEPPEAQFRRLPGAPAPPWPREMRALARRVRARQTAAVELYDLLDEDPPWPLFDLEYADTPMQLAARAREALGIPLDAQRSWQDRSGYEPLRKWVDAVEAAGVLVMQDGSLTVEDMRGFASTHETVPAIVANTNDDPRARAFTVLHEFGHLLRARAGRPTGPNTERWCDDLASELLMPHAEFEQDFLRRREPNLLRRVDAIALLYGVTPLAAAVRLARLRIVPQDAIDEVILEIRRRSEEAQRSESGGGDYYRTKVGRLGPSFIQLVFAALDSQAVSYPVAAELLGAKVNHFPALRERVVERAIGT